MRIKWCTSAPHPEVVAPRGTTSRISINHLHALSSRWSATQRTWSDRLFTHPQNWDREVHNSSIRRLVGHQEFWILYLRKDKQIYASYHRPWPIEVFEVSSLADFTFAAVIESHRNGSLRHSALDAFQSTGRWVSTLASCRAVNHSLSSTFEASALYIC